MSRIFFLEAMVLRSKPRIYQLASNGMEFSNGLGDKLLVPGQLKSLLKCSLNQALSGTVIVLSEVKVSDSIEQC